MKPLIFPTMFLFVAALLAPSLSAAESVPSVDLGRSIAVGRLGQPLGKVMRVEGAAVESNYPRSKGQDNTLFFRVTAVEGRALPQPVVIELGFFSSDISQELPPGERRTFIGYETGQFSGLPDAAGQHLSAIPATTGYGFTTELVVLK